MRGENCNQSKIKSQREKALSELSITRIGAQYFSAMSRSGNILESLMCGGSRYCRACSVPHSLGNIIYIHLVFLPQVHIPSPVFVEFPLSLSLSLLLSVFSLTCMQNLDVNADAREIADTKNKKLDLFANLEQSSIYTIYPLSRDKKKETKRK